jgi:hypothetical protein
LFPIPFNSDKIGDKRACLLLPPDIQPVDGQFFFPLTPAPLPEGEGKNEPFSPREKVAEGRMRGKAVRLC